DRSSADLFRHARRETLLTLALIFMALVWTVGYSYYYGYLQEGAPPPEEGEFRQLMGLPDWVFFGIFLPWMACTAATVWLSLYGIADDDLGREGGGGEPHGH